MSLLGNLGVAVAAAQGITDRTIASWNPTIPRDPRVMVPIQVDALVVRQAGQQWADTSMDRTPPGDGIAVPAGSLLPKPFSLRAQDRPPGVYLHWVLPDALTRGAQSASTGTADPVQAGTLFPAIPDRWLIARLSPSLSRADRRAVRAWILQSHDDDPAPIDLDSWREPGAAPAGIKNPLTALGYGDVSWAGYFDSTQNRLAFYDDLAGVTSGPLAYLVCGWYSDPALDPLGSAQVHSLGEFDARLRQLGWALASTDFDQSKAAAASHVVAARALNLGVTPTRAAVNINTFETAGGLRGFDPQTGTYATDGSWWPQMTILHGGVVGIGWPKIGWAGSPSGVWDPKAVPNISDSSVVEPVGGPPDPSAIRVAIGNTIGEALAKLVATETNRADETRILEAFQMNALAVLNQPDGATQVDALLHANAFASLPGGETTETVWQPPTSVNQASPANPPTPGPGVFSRYQHSHVKPPVTGLGGQTGVLSTGAVRTLSRQSPEFLRETAVAAGSLSDIVNAGAPSGPAPAAPPPQEGKWIDVKRALPRFFQPGDPILLVERGGASFKHKPGDLSADGLLYCRLTGDSVTELSSRAQAAVPAAGGRVSVQGADLLERGVEHGGTPPECEDLLRELALLDPGTALAAAHATAGTNPTPALVASLSRGFMVEQTAWQATRDPRIDAAPLAAHSGIGGRLPSPFSIGLPVRPWDPIRLDWRIEFAPSAGGVADWALDEIDYRLADAELAAPIVFESSCVLTDGANRIAASAIQQALRQAASAGGSGITEPGTALKFFSTISRDLMVSFKNLAAGAADATGVPSVDRQPLDDIASALGDMDVLTGGLDGLNGFLRGDQFFHLRSGFIRVAKLRLVDGFGQFVDLLGSGSDGAAAATAIIKSDPMTVPGHDELCLLPPRYTAPARLWFRFVDGKGSGVDATLDPKTGNTISPVCGYLMPNHLDDAIEFFDADGGDIGFVRPQDDKTIAWEEAPGRTSTVGQRPDRAIANPFAAGVAQALVDWGIADAGMETESDNALQALLRVVDSTRWAVDPFGHAGDEHLALLVGHPVVVVRAQLRLELQEPVHPEVANQTKVAVRLGALTHWNDGLFGYFVNDDYTTLHCADAASAGLARQVGANRGFLQPITLVPEHFAKFAADTGTTPVTHPYVDTSGVIEIHPNQTVDLTLLLEPHTAVHATCGLLPRKDIALRREWVTAALAKLSPTFRFGPVLVDPAHIRMPLATDINGTWSWDYRTDVNTWVEAPVTNATQDALLPADPPSGTEGWLRLTPPKDNS